MRNIYQKVRRFCSRIEAIYIHLIIGVETDILVIFKTKSLQDLIDKGMISNNDRQNPKFTPTSKMEVALRRQALDDIFDQTFNNIRSS